MYRSELKCDWSIVFYHCSTFSALHVSVHCNITVMKQPNIIHCSQEILLYRKYYSCLVC